MKISILQQDLIAPLQAVSRSVGIKPALPVLANILLETESGKLKLSATNLELGVIKLVNAQIEEEGQITVPARTLLEIVSSLGSEKLSLESKSDQLKITTPTFSATLNGISATEFPSIPTSKEEALHLPASALKEAIPHIAFASAVDEGRPVLTGILTQIKKGEIEFVATDGFRLAHKKVSIKDYEGESFKFLIPRRTFEEVIRIITEDLAKEEEQVLISTSENQNQIIFQIGQTIVSSRLIEGQFPAWEKIVPQEFENRTVIERGELLKAVKLASVFARTDANIVKVEAKAVEATQPGKLKVTSQAKELGGQETDLDAQIEGKDILIAFNSKYLTEALSATNKQQVEISFSGNLSPALIKPLGEEGLEYVIMPIRLS